MNLPSFPQYLLCFLVLGSGFACESGSGGSWSGGSGGFSATGGGTGLVGVDGGFLTDDGLVENLPFLTLPDGDDPQLPLTNGIMTSTEAGDLVLASDAEGHAVYLVHHAAPVSITKVELAATDFPGRVVTSSDRAFVLLRRSGRVAVIDLASATVTRTLEVCRLVEGLLVDGDRLHVVCRDGELVSHDLTTLSETRRLLLDDDLRDVARRGEQLVVSRFRRAELLFLNDAGVVERRISPELMVEDVKATQLSRFVVLDDGRIVAAVQASVTVPVRADGTASQVVGAYAAVASCGAIVTPALVLLDPDALDPIILGPGPVGPPSDVRFTVAADILRGTAGMLDFAIRGSTIEVVAPANGLMTAEMRARARTFDGSGMPSSFSLEIASASQAFGGCLEPAGSYDGSVPLAVATLGTHTVTLLSSPLRLIWSDGRTQSLDPSIRENTGFRLFHANTGMGISCASCHPEGREDGHTWSFVDIGLRRTQNLEGGFNALAPFHWDAEFERFDVLLEDVMVHRMGLGHHLLPLHVEALATFIDSFPAPPEPSTSEASERGELVFATQGCASCHEGARFSDGQLHDVGSGGGFITPPLSELRQRAPYLHDGCADTSAEVFGPCGGTAHDLELSAGAVDDLVAYLLTL